MSFNDLPAEVLAQIISYLPVPAYFPELLVCASVCKSLSRVAIAALYRDVDLRVDSSVDEGETHDCQSILIRSIAE